MTSKYICCMRYTVVAAGVVGIFANAGMAQTGLAGAYADGQVFLRWTLSPNAVYTYDVYSSHTPESDIANMTLVGRVFPEEATGQRMHNLRPSATLRVPNGTGYATLAADQGAFAWTPHEAGTLYFAVVANAQTAVTIDNRVRVAFNYDPVGEPVKPHLQFTHFTAGGYPYAVYMLWVDGREDPEDGRPDFPVMANAQRGGVPHVFAVTLPIGGLPQDPYPAVFSLHGGEGAYQNFMPGEPSRTNMSLELTNGIVITPDDNLYWQAPLSRQSAVTAWFGYARHLDPFSQFARTDPPSDEVIVNYTSRRVLWFADWLASGRGPFNVDAHRISLIGHSAGSRGASVLSRQAPQKFASAVIQSALLNYPDPASPYPPIGKFSQNLATNMVSPETGLPVTYQEALHPSTRLNSAPYIPYTRLYSGKRDDNPHGGWTPTARAGLDDINASQLGIIVNWDEREHGVDLWAEDTLDAFDDPAHCDPWPDIGQWIYPVKTARHGAQYLADRFRNDESYPGFFDCDENLIAPGRQPDPGTGNPCLADGVAWGSWGGCLDWTPATIVDTPTRWECTLFLRGLSAVSVDNSLVRVVRTGLAPRRTQAFRPAAGSTVYWIARTPMNGPIAQYGQAIADSDGVVKVEGLLIPREDLALTRLILSTGLLCHADFNGDGFVDAFDYDDYVACFEGEPCPPGRNADTTGDGFVDAFDYDAFVEAFEIGC